MPVGDTQSKPVSWLPWKDWKLSKEFPFQNQSVEKYERHLMQEGDPRFVLNLKYKMPDDSEQILGVPLRQVGRYEIQWLLLETGFKLAEAFGNYKKQSFTNFSPHIITVAQIT